MHETPRGTLEDGAREAAQQPRPSPLLLARIQERLLELENRRRILERIRLTPGIHLRRLAREVGLAIGTVEPHVHALERYELVTSLRRGRRRSFFVREGMDPSDLELLHHLRHRTWRTIALALVAEPGSTLQAIANRLPFSLSTTSYHMTRLVKAGVVERASVGRFALFSLRDPERVARLLERFGATYRTAPLQRRDAQEESVFHYLLRRIPARQAGPRALVRVLESH